jgi:hypothetical protein
VQASLILLTEIKDLARHGFVPFVAALRRL